jgi:signal recognition particle receptor subunit beta
MASKLEHKIIFTGPVGAGKTTAITALSDIDVIGTDARASDFTVQQKKSTTVAMDYGLLNLGDGARVHLYGTPGQERFDFMWDILSKGSLGLILLIDHSRNNSLADLSFFMKSFKNLISISPLVIGVSKLDLKGDRVSLRDYADHVYKLVDSGFSLFNATPPIFEIDGRRKQDIKTLVESLLYSIDPGIEG